MEGPSPRRIPLRQVADWDALILESEFSISALAKKCGVSARHLQRHVKTVFNKRLGSFISSVRLARAHERLLKGESVKEVALGLGYKHVSHFSRNFRSHFGYCASAILLQLHHHPETDAEKTEQLELNMRGRVKGSDGTSGEEEE